MFWPYQSANPWSQSTGLLTDQSRLWLNALFNALGAAVTPASPPADGQVLVWDAANKQWVPKTPTVIKVNGVTLS
jgi:hypothetical protein